VPAFSASGSGNATLSKGPIFLGVDSPKFKSSATVQAPSGNQDVANWEIGYVQTISSYFHESRYKSTLQQTPVSTPIRDALAGTPAPWYGNDAHKNAVAGTPVPVSMSDAPYHQAMWFDPGRPNTLTSTIRRITFKTWLIARQRVSRAIVYLKNISWGVNFVVNVTDTGSALSAVNAADGMSAPVIGNGQGSATPVLDGPIANDVTARSTKTVPLGNAVHSPSRTPAPTPVRSPAPVRAPAPTPAPSPVTSPAVALTPVTTPAASGVLTPEITKLVSGQSGGDPLPSSVLAQLETSLDVPLGLVRVHSDSRTRTVVDGSGARAFTYGLHIYLGSQASASDLALMAHEITHVIQQQGRPVLQMYSAATTGDAFEHEAHHVAGAVQQGQRATVSRRTAGARPQAFWPVSQIVDWIEDRAWDLVNHFAPDLVPIIRQGPLEWLKEKISHAVDSIVNTLMAPVRAITGLVSSLRGHFANLLAWLRDAAAKIARGDCSSITEAAHKIHEVFMGIASPIIDRIKSLATRVSNFFGGLWDRFGAPVWNFLRRVGGWVWDKIQSFGRWLWDITAPIRRALARAWRWIKNKLGIGEGPEGQNGILQWIQRKAQSAWDNYILPFIERFKRPLLVIGGILLMLSPAGPIIAIGAIAYGVIRGVQAIRQYFGTRGGIVNGRNILQNEIIPGIVSTINRVAAFLREKAQFLADKLNSIVGGLGNAAGAVAGTIIGFIARGLTWLAERFGELVNWVMDHVMSFVTWVGSVLQRLVTFLQPVLDFLRRVAAVVRNILRLPYEFGARIWNAIPACIRDPFIDFFIPLILRQIPFFAELGSTPEAWQQTRASIMLLVRQIFRDFDLWGAMRTAFGIVVRALRIPVDLIRQLIEKASQAWSAVLAAPIRFIRSALQAILRGVGRFVSNFLSHLWFGVRGWLFNAVSERGITPPSSWTDFRAVFGFVLDVLGISLDHVLELLARRIGQPAVARIRTMLRVLTGVWEWVSVAIREGPAGIWRMIVERLRDLGNMVLETAVRWVMTRIMAIVGARLAAMAASAGLSAILEAVYAVYQAIQTAIEYARRIIQVLITIFDTVIQIAQGVIDPAAQGVETGLRMIMPVVIGFLANYAALGGIGARIREIIDGVRERVDTAILWLIDRALAAGRWILDRLRAGVAAVVGWWQRRIPFRSQSGESHTLFARGEPPNVRVMVSSEEERVSEKVAAIIERRRAGHRSIPPELREAVTIAARLESTPPTTTETDSQRAAIETDLNRLRDILVTFMPSETLPFTAVTYTMNTGRAGSVLAKPLTSRAGNTAGNDDTSSINSLFPRGLNRMTWKALHMLNFHLHGPNTTWNLVPGDGSANALMATIETRAKTRVDAGDTLWYEVAIQEYHDNPTITWHNAFMKRLTMRGGSYDPAQPSVMIEDSTLVRPVASGPPPAVVTAPAPVNFSHSGHEDINNAEDPRTPVGPTGLRQRLGGSGGSILVGIGQRIVNARSSLMAAEHKQEWNNFAHLQQYLTGYVSAAKIQELNDLLTRFPGQFQLK
jgi:phage-related protein